MFYSWLTQMRGFVPEFWLTEQMLHMLTWDESSLDQLSAPSWCSLSPGPKSAQFWCQEQKRGKENIHRQEGDEKTMNLDSERDITAFSLPNFLFHDLSKFKRRCVLNYSTSSVFMMPLSLSGICALQLLNLKISPLIYSLVTTPVFSF